MCYNCCIQVCSTPRHERPYHHTSATKLDSSSNRPLGYQTWGIIPNPSEAIRADPVSLWLIWSNNSYPIIYSPFPVFSDELHSSFNMLWIECKPFDLPFGGQSCFSESSLNSWGRHWSPKKFFSLVPSLLYGPESAALHVDLKIFNCFGLYLPGATSFVDGHIILVVAKDLADHGRRNIESTDRFFGGSSCRRQSNGFFEMCKGVGFIFGVYIVQKVMKKMTTASWFVYSCSVVFHVNITLDLGLVPKVLTFDASWKKSFIMAQ